MTSLGATFRPQNRPETLPAMARLAEEVGLEELWLWEDCFLIGGMASTAIALASSEHVRVGLGIAPLPFRNVATQAMEIATLTRTYGDRAMVALGHGVQEWMGQIGARAGSPMTLMREYVEALRALLAGEEVSTQGRYVQLDRVKLDWPPLTPPPIVLGVTGPKSIKLSGELADATILTASTTLDGVRAAREVLGSAGHRLIVFVQTATGPGAAGRVDESAALSGDAEQVAEGVRRFVEAGADTVILEPVADEPDLAGFLRFAAREVRPLVP